MGWTTPDARNTGPCASGPADWSLPEKWGKRWEAIFDTSAPEREGDSFDAGLTIPVAGRSMVVFRRIDTQP